MKITLRYFLYIMVISLFVLYGMFQASPAGAGPPFEETVDRIFGADRYETAAAVSQAGWEQSDTLVLTQGSDFPDSLAGVPLAYQLNAPILLTPTDRLAEATRTEIERLGAERVVILGGENAISAKVAKELTDMGLAVERIGGTNRFDTAAQIALRLAAERDGGSAETAIIAYGFTFPDAMTAASYAAENGYPILLTGSIKLSDHTREVIDELGLCGAVIAGGPQVVGGTVRTELEKLGMTVERVYGDNRYETAVALAEYFTPEDLENGGGHYYAATGYNFPDALAGAVLAGKQGRGILLVRGDRVASGNPSSDPVEDFLIAREIERITILGGEPAVSDVVARRLYDVMISYINPPEAPPDPPKNQSTTHQVLDDGILYGLDYWGKRTRITEAPEFMPAGDYVMDRFNFFLKKDGELEYRGHFYYLEQIPYAIMPLHSPADPEITAELLAQRVSEIVSVNSPFKDPILMEAFIRAQETWGINALYLVAHAALESGWGTSKIARDKNNIFGYMAYDSDPYGNAATFNSMEDSILFCSAYIRRFYLSEGGRWHRGADLAGMNFYYASDPMWAVKIARIMEVIYPASGYSATEKVRAMGRVNSESLNLRAGPGTDRDIIDTLELETPVTILGMVIVDENTYWYKVDTPLGEGWVYGEYINLETEVMGSVYFSDWYKVTETGLNVRSGPGVDGYDILDKIHFGDKLTIMEVRPGENHVWFRVTYPGNDENVESWVAANFTIVDW